MNRHYFLSSLLYSFVTPALTILLPKVAQEFKNATFYSAFYICFIIGFIAGSIMTEKMKVKVKTISITWLLSALPVLLMLFLTKNWFGFSLLIFSFGFITNIHNILSESMIQIVSDDQILGRILTTIRTSTSIGGPIE